MINKIVLSLSFILLGTGVFAQSEEIAMQELTLSDAVMQQYRRFAPTGLNMLQWVPDSDCYAFLSDNYQTLMKASVRNTTARKWVDIQTVNEKLGSEFSSGIFFIPNQRVFTYSVCLKQWIIRA